MKYILAFCALATFYLMAAHQLDQAYARGRAEALRTNPVSEELEMTCAGLWVGEQAKKAAAK